MTSRVVRSWIEAFGTAVSVKASEMTVEMATNDSVDSLPPSVSQHGMAQASGLETPLSTAALPDLIAREAMLAMTSGRASNIIRRTPIGQLTRSKLSPSSSFVLSVILPTRPYRV